MADSRIRLLAEIVFVLLFVAGVLSYGLVRARTLTREECFDRCEHGSYIDGVCRCDKERTTW